MEPIPETRVVLNELARYGDTEVEASLMRMARLTQDIVPELVGLSLGKREGGLVFTLVASSLDVAAIDAAQYLDGGPCVKASLEGEVEAWTVPAHPDQLLDEERWALYARTTAAAGIASSLSLPLTTEGSTVGSVNLYASTPKAFDGHHKEIARAVGASTTLLVTNADLPFSTRVKAAQAPTRLAESDDINIATGILAVTLEVDLPTARTKLADAAVRAGISEAQAARTIVEVRNR